MWDRPVRALSERLLGRAGVGRGHLARDAARGGRQLLRREREAVATGHPLFAIAGACRPGDLEFRRAQSPDGERRVARGVSMRRGEPAAWRPSLLRYRNAMPAPRMRDNLRAADEHKGPAGYSANSVGQGAAYDFGLRRDTLDRFAATNVGGSSRARLFVRRSRPLAAGRRLRHT